MAAGRHTPNTGISSKATHLPEETGVQLLYAASDDIWCRNLDTDQTSTEQTCGRTDQNGKKYAQHHIHREKDQHMCQGKDKTHRYNLHCERKMKWSWAGHINRLKDDRWTSRVTTWRPYDKKSDKGDQPSGGETTWTNTGATPYGREQHKTG